MRLYLMRHGKADFAPQDELRELSTRGRRDVGVVAAHLAAQGMSLDRVYHSSLVRAAQTAHIMAEALNPKHAPEVLAGIEPWGDVDDFIKMAQDWKEDTLVCGHEPFMGYAAKTLLAGKGEALVIKTATVMAFERLEMGSGWYLDWLVNPKTIEA